MLSGGKIVFVAKKNAVSISKKPLVSFQFVVKHIQFVVKQLQLPCLGSETKIKL